MRRANIARSTACSIPSPDTLRENAIGIVLSGTGSDGALGLKAIKECGGLTIAQGTDSDGPMYPDMPAGAISTGAVDLIAPADQIPRPSDCASRRPGSNSVARVTQYMSDDRD